MKDEFGHEDSKWKALSYAKAGVDRSVREKSRVRISSDLKKRWRTYAHGKPLELPFGPVFPISPRRESFLDLEIEGIGTKTLLAEMDPEGYSSIGMDGVAMVVNDVIRSGAAPLLLADAVHVARSGSMVESLVRGVRKGARIAGCVLASGETGDVAEILHTRLAGSCAEPFDLLVSCLGIVSDDDVVRGSIKEGDPIIGIESSGIHSNGISLARRILLRPWGGKYELLDIPGGCSRPVIKELLEPTRIYVREVLESVKNFGLKAAVHI
ncbi:MAG: AIR synthase related protein, partial [Nitrososphaerales archaeon]